MSFTNEEKTKLFDKLEGHTVSLAEIKKELDFGSEKFLEIKKQLTDFRDTREGLNIHLDRHKTVNWILGVSGSIITGLGTWWLVFKGN